MKGMKDRCEKCGCELNCGKHKACCCRGITGIIAAIIVAGSIVYVGHMMKGGCMMHGEMMKMEKK